MRVRRFTMFVVGSVLLSVGGPVTSARAAAEPLPLDAILSVPGHGWGHGRGMGQWGARGYAEQGLTYSQILATYYDGTTLGTRDSAEEIRVLVETSPDVIVTSATPYTAQMGGKTVATSTSSLPFMRARWDGSSYTLERSASHTGSWSRVTSSTAYPIFLPGTSMLKLIFASGSAKVYRGAIHTRATTDNQIRAINELLLQHYLYGVVPAEMPSSWPINALRAQSVAARTYAIYKKLNSRANDTVFDICATTSCQVYAGYGSASSPTGSVSSYERSSTNDAIDATAGRVVLYNGDPILAEFSSSTGGHSAPGSVPYQRAVPDLGDTISPHHDWKAQIAVREVEARWPQIGRLTDIRILERDGFGEWGGRVQRMRLDGTQGSLEISGGAWRTAFAWPGRANGVRGTFFTVLLYSGTLVSKPEHVVVERGDKTFADVRIRNTGSGSWPVHGDVVIGTTEPSALASDQWISPTRAAWVYRNVSVPGKESIAPGEVAQFRVPFTGGSAGTTTERFSLLADDASPLAPNFDLTVQSVDPWLEEIPNLLRSGSFDVGISPWIVSGTGSGDGSVVDQARHGARVLRLRGGGVKRVTQRIALAGGKARTFTFGGWNRTEGSSGSGGAVDLIGTVRYTDRTATSVSVLFPRLEHPWVYEERTFSSDPRKTVASVELTARTVRQTGTAYFDALRLHESPPANHSFEEGLTDWSRTGFVSGDGATAGTARDGSRSLVMLGAAGTKSLTQAFDLPSRRTERFAVSFWHQTEGLSQTSPAPTLSLTLRAPDGTASVSTVEIPTADHAWTFVETLVSAPEALSDADIKVSITDQQGKVFVDAIRVARTFTADPSLEAGDLAWAAYNAGEAIGSGEGRAREAASGVELVGAAGRRGVVQRVALSSGPGALFYLQGWSMTENVASRGGYVGYVVVFRNTDGTTTILTMPIGTGTNPWTFMERPVRSKKRFSRIDLYVQLNDRSGLARFDAIRLARA